jgi:hypothetical protein
MSVNSNFYEERISELMPEKKLVTEKLFKDKTTEGKPLLPVSAISNCGSP